MNYALKPKEEAEDRIDKERGGRKRANGDIKPMSATLLEETEPITGLRLEVASTKLYTVNKGI